MSKILTLLFTLALACLACTLTAELNSTPGTIPTPAGDMTPLKTGTTLIRQTAATPILSPDPIPTPAPPACLVTVESLNLRQGPGVEYPATAYLLAGDRLFLTQSTPAGPWSEVTTTEGLTGWVNVIYITCK